MLAFNQVTKRYGYADALSDVTFAVQPGEWVTIMGGSGSGKSTIAKLLLRAEDPTSGWIEVDGVALSSLPVDVLQLYRGRVGIAFQEVPFLEHSTLAENVGLPLELQGVPSSTTSQAVDIWLKRIGLSGKAHALPKHLCRSERTLAGLARALISSPKIVVADEPLNGLDESERTLAIGMLKEQHAAGSTVIMLVADAVDAEMAGGRRLELAGGRLGAGAKTVRSTMKQADHHNILEQEGMRSETPDAPLSDEQPTAAPKEEAQAGGGRKIKITAIHS
jgi:ABC-type ATPase involved in cell division